MQEIEKFNNSIIVAKKKIKEIKPQYEQYSTLFHTIAVEGLYQTLSDFAGRNNLVISKIEKKSIKAQQKRMPLQKQRVKRAKLLMKKKLKM